MYNTTKVTIGEDAQAMLARDAKVALLGTVDDDGYPHLTFISSLQGLGDDKLTFGQFSTGISKDSLLRWPDCAFLALTRDLKWLRGTARYTHTAKTGPEFDAYNNKPIFRYNSYFGFNTIWYLDLLSISLVMKLPIQQIPTGAILSRIAMPAAARSERQALSPYGRLLFSELVGPKFICFEKAEGGLAIVPVFQARAAGTDRLVISGRPFGEDLKELPQGARVGVMALNMNMQSVLVKGTFTSTARGARIIEIDRVYNSMPPQAGYIYPRADRPAAVTEF